MARGTAALGTNGQPGFDKVYSFLYDNNLDVNNVGFEVGFIIAQVKNRANVMVPSSILLFASHSKKKSLHDLPSRTTSFAKLR